MGDVEPGVVGDDVVMDRQYRLCVRLYPSNLQKNFYNIKKTQNIQFQNFRIEACEQYFSSSKKINGIFCVVIYEEGGWPQKC